MKNAEENTTTPLSWITINVDQVHANEWLDSRRDLLFGATIMYLDV